jgi:arylsulfatase A-like enzyme
MTDQHNAACMGHEGRSVRTPNLDAIAQRGVRFSQAFCNNPICSPSRISFITGQYPHTHGHVGNDVFDYPEGNPDTLSALARRNGYQTAIIGKAHMIQRWDEEGFEHIRYCDLCDADRNDPLKHHYFKYLHDNGLAEKYDLGSLPPDHPGKGDHLFISDIPHEHSLEVWTGNETLEFLRNRDTRRPFFAQMTFQRPHAPLSPSPERADMYSPDDIDIPGSARDLFERAFATKPGFQQQHIATRRGYPYVPVDEDELRRQLCHYYALVTIIDEEIGRVIAYLREQGELDNTVIVYVADHGDFAGEHGLMQKNFGIYESIHRIPFLLWYPGCPDGREVTELAESVDLYPTLCQLMGIEVPDCVEGESLIPVIEDGAPGKDAVICEWSRVRPYPMLHAIRTRDYRLVYYGSDQEGELYDRRTDPQELTNLYDNPQYLETQLALLGRMFDHVMDYSKKSDAAYDRVESHRTRNTFSRLLHKGMVNWRDLDPLYKP